MAPFENKFLVFWKQELYSEWHQQKFLVQAKLRTFSSMSCCWEFTGMPVLGSLNIIRNHKSGVLGCDLADVLILASHATFLN